MNDVVGPGLIILALVVLALALAGLWWACRQRLQRRERTRLRTEQLLDTMQRQFNYRLEPIEGRNGASCDDRGAAPERPRGPD